jgi:peptidoglycan/LPS O-acetylase OafA/YrhL
MITAGRQYYLDNLKVWLTILVIFHHAGQAYGNGGGWAYTPSNPAEFLPWLGNFFSVNAGFFMGLFFLISGYFVPGSYDRQGGKVFVRKKLVRLGIPLLVMGALLSVLAGKFETGHMWYVESLLVFCLLYALYRKFFPPVRHRQQKPVLWGLLLIGLGMGIGSFIIRKVSPQDHWIWPFGIIPLPMEPAHYLQYVMMFVLGILARRFGWVEKMSDRLGATALTIGLLLASGIYFRGHGAWSAFIWRWFGIYESFLCVFLCTGLLWLFRRFFNGTSPFMQWCSAQSYGAYVFHMLLMLLLQAATDTIWMGALGKFLFIGQVTCVAAFSLTWALRLIPAVRKVL